MPEGITENGIQTDTYSTILQNLQESYTNIYAKDGDNINFGSETPDGQLINILTQMGTDSRELATEVYNSFDPSKCTGVVQDSRYALNYIERKGGTYTIQNIDIVLDRTVTLQGLDANYNESEASSYTVSDNAGNLWYLIDTVTLESGSYSLPFRSKELGLVQPVIGTITNQVTIVLGVISVINSVAPTTLGETQETDAEFRVRRERSTQTRSENNIDAILSNILNLEGVTDATAWVNTSNTTDTTGTPAHYMWVIVEGGANSDIANIIYANSGGAGSRGDISVDVPSISGQIFTVNFDRPVPVPLYIQFTFKLTTQLSAIDLDGIKEYIASNLTYNVNEDAETSKVGTIASEAIVANGGGGYALAPQISLNGTNWTDYIESSSLENKFVVDITRISINVQQ